MTRTNLRVATWNVNCFTAGRREDKRRLLELEDWDIALLQEVGPNTFEAFTETGEFRGMSGIDLVGGSWGRNAHGAAVLCRDSCSLTEAGVVPVDGDNRLEARITWGAVETTAGPIRVASAHMRNAAGNGAEAKMAHYRALHDWVTAAPRPTVLGIDTNSWTDWVDSAPAGSEAGDDPYSDEHRFVRAEATHGLRDVLVDHVLNNRPDLLERRRLLGAVGADGALEVTYQRAKGNWPRVNRMDRIYASPDIAVDDVRTLYADALTVGSDHALVVAHLGVSA